MSLRGRGLRSSSNLNALDKVPPTGHLLSRQILFTQTSNAVYIPRHAPNLATATYESTSHGVPLPHRPPPAPLAAHLRRDVDGGRHCSRGRGRVRAGARVRLGGRARHVALQGLRGQRRRDQRWPAARRAAVGRRLPSRRHVRQGSGRHHRPSRVRHRGGGRGHLVHDGRRGVGR
jgi:hypothetical protein